MYSTSTKKQCRATSRRTSDKASHSLQLSRDQRTGNNGTIQLDARGTIAPEAVGGCGDPNLCAGLCSLDKRMTEVVRFCNCYQIAVS